MATHSPDWEKIRAEWTRGKSVANLSAAHAVSASAIYARKKRERWKKPGQEKQKKSRSVHEEALALYDILSAQLHEQVALLSAEPRAGELRKLPDLIRSHRKALMALLDARKAATPKFSASGGSSGTLDLQAAREEILSRLARLQRTL